MTAAAPSQVGGRAEDGRTWGIAGAAALIAHGAIAALVLAWSRPSAPPPPEPVMVVELPGEAAPAAAQSAAVDRAQPRDSTLVEPRAQPLAPPLDTPAVRAPLPQDAVRLPPPAPVAAPVRPSGAAQPMAAPISPAAASGSSAGSSTSPGTDPRARAAEVDYFSLISAHLNRRKTYPTEARKAHQEGVVTIRFTVARDGSVSGGAIKRSSGHDLLDQATLALLQRVAPLPRMPAAMQRDSVSIALPIEYSLKKD